MPRPSELSSPRLGLLAAAFAIAVACVTYERLPDEDGGIEDAGVEDAGGHAIQDAGSSDGSDGGWDADAPDDDAGSAAGVACDEETGCDAGYWCDLPEEASTGTCQRECRSHNQSCSATELCCQGSQQMVCNTPQGTQCGDAGNCICEFIFP